MPKFIDHHAMPPMSPEKQVAMMKQIKTAIESGKPDKFGVTMLNVFTAPGEAWGYSEAPNAEAIIKSHEALGVSMSLKDVVKVTPLVNS